MIEKLPFFVSFLLYSKTIVLFLEKNYCFEFERLVMNLKNEQWSFYNKWLFYNKQSFLKNVHQRICYNDTIFKISSYNFQFINNKSLKTNQFFV